MSSKTRFTRAMACIRLCPDMGLCTYMVARDGTSKPVNHISTTMAIFRGEPLSLNFHASSTLRALLPMTARHSSGSLLPWVIATATFDFQAGRSSKMRL